MESTKGNSIIFIDAELDSLTGEMLDFGAVKNDSEIHSKNIDQIVSFVNTGQYLCGHNIIHHDLKIMEKVGGRINIDKVIDTLYLSALLFPKKPYHSLVKNDKLQTGELNNPLNDSKKARDLFYDELNAFHKLDNNFKKILCTILRKVKEFKDFFTYIEFSEQEQNLGNFIKQYFYGKICQNAELGSFIYRYPIELSYCLSLINADCNESVLPFWVKKKFPQTENIYHVLRGTPCDGDCEYCRNAFDIKVQLKNKFGFEKFRTYGGEKLQEKAVSAAVHNKSLLAIFPTGGGKSLTFQLPALIAADTCKGLTVVISPLQSLMKDQVDNLNKQGVVDAVTINGMMDPIGRAEAVERVESGIASILYISPESLRSKTMERLLLGRNVVRFVIDEAHCFSAWGHDFRVDYLYIGDFIKKMQEQKGRNIPVSCFTATAKQKVIADIKEYFKDKLNIELELYATNAVRENLRYEVLYKETDQEKYITLRNLIEQKNCPTIVYASRTKRTEELAAKLQNDGFSASAFHGKMERNQKIENQEKFINGEIQIIVATSAFGMGVDKKDVQLVIHYDISDSLENYVQESGRAGRDESLSAECYILFNENDLDKHFIMLNQTKLSISEIQQMWKAIKNLTGKRGRICRSALDLAREAGWDFTYSDVETKVKTAITALETAGYVKRGHNIPRIYADSILCNNVFDAQKRIAQSGKFSEKQKAEASRIISYLIAKRSRRVINPDDAESRVDYIADREGFSKEKVIEIVGLLREANVLADEKDIVGFVRQKKSNLLQYLNLEEYLIKQLAGETQIVDYKEINKQIQNGKRDNGGKLSDNQCKRIKAIFDFWIIKGYIQKPKGENRNKVKYEPLISNEEFEKMYEKRRRIVEFLENYLQKKASSVSNNAKDDGYIEIDFSVLELKRAYADEPTLFGDNDATQREIEDALLYMSRMDAVRLEGGFLVIYTGMDITRLEMDNKIQYKKDDYAQLNEYYQKKIEQIHIVGEYANMMVKDYNAALAFVSDYFQIDYKLFLKKYFDNRSEEITRNITPEKYNQLFAGLSRAQADIISDAESQYILVAAGPGSGKTKILVHKLASLMMLEDVKHEQLLMLTFSRAAATEFKSRLIDMMGSPAYFVEVKTFHSYCFDLVGRNGTLQDSDKVVAEAVAMIENRNVENAKISKRVVVIDEAQDMDENEYRLIRALMNKNEGMRVIAVGDDDQNIYNFRGASSLYMKKLIYEGEGLYREKENAKKYELVDNFRSTRNIVLCANEFAKTIRDRIKQQPIHAISKDDGRVCFVKFVDRGAKLVAGVVDVVLRTYKIPTEETACVLTTRNEDALLLYSMLVSQGYNAKLIQKNDQLFLYNLMEIRYFFDLLREDVSPIISDETWNHAKTKLKEQYVKSKNLSLCVRLLETFENINEKKYYSDFEEYVKNSAQEDFCDGSAGEIFVSTIHKAKGKEFDKVYLHVGENPKANEEAKRVFYVGMTRAKRELYICYADYFRDDVKRKLPFVECQNAPIVCEETTEIYLPCTHKDVNLGYMKGIPSKERIAAGMYAGEPLDFCKETIKDGRRLSFSSKLNGHICKVAAASKRFLETIEIYEDKGYTLDRAEVLYVVKWRDNEDEKEYNIVLPAVYMKKI